MLTCLVLCCKNKGTIPGVHYFCLTKARYDTWMGALGRDPTVERLSEKNVICSRHFSPEDVYMKGNRMLLKPNAVPRLFLRRRDEITSQERTLREVQDIEKIVQNDNPSSPQQFSVETDDNVEILFVDDKENSCGIDVKVALPQLKLHRGTEYTIEDSILVPKCKGSFKTTSELEIPCSSTALEAECTNPSAECSMIEDSFREAQERTDDSQQFTEVENDTDFANDIKTCRTCVEAGDNVCSILSNIKNFVSTFRDMIVLLVPQMDNVLHEDDVICEKCCEILISCAKFIERCLRVGIDHTNQKPSIDCFDTNKSKNDGTSAVSPDQFSADTNSENQDGDPGNQLDVHQDNGTSLVEDFEKDICGSEMDCNEQQLDQVHNGDVLKMCYLKEWPKSIVEHDRLISVRNLEPQLQYEFTQILASNDVKTLQLSQFDKKMDRKRIILVGTTIKGKKYSRYFGKKYLFAKHMSDHKFVDQRRTERDRLNKLRIEKKKAERSTKRRLKKGENLVCKTCSERCSSKEELAAHLKLHPPVICEKCGKGFASQNLLNIHVPVHNPLNSYICEVCGKGFKSEKGLKTHMMLHENKTHLCSICSKMFNTPLKLRIHLKYTHGEGLSSVLPCKECNKVFKAPWLLKAHYRLMHLKDDTYKCDTCGRGFSRPDYLRRHKRRHIIYDNATNTTKYPMVEGVLRTAQCQICNKVLKSVFNLRQHIRTHGKLSRFPCKYCNMTFKVIYQRNRHETLHEKSDLKYRCGICWKRFECQEELDQHSSKHNNLKYKCEMCDQSFARKHLLDDHFVKSHVDNDDVVDESKAIFTAGLGLQNDDLGKP